jgi:hypothetical protein
VCQRDAVVIADPYADVLRIRLWRFHLFVISCAARGITTATVGSCKCVSRPAIVPP